MFAFRDRWGIVPIIEYSNTLISRFRSQCTHSLCLRGGTLVDCRIQYSWTRLFCKTMISVSKLFWILFSGSAIFVIHIVHVIFVSTGLELRDLSAHARSALQQNFFFFNYKITQNRTFQFILGFRTINIYLFIYLLL